MRDVAEKPIWCFRKEYQIPLLKCPSCRVFPCRGLTSQHMQLLHDSLFTEEIFDGFSARSCKMYVFKLDDGSLKEAPKGFSVDKPDFNLLKNVDEVLCVSKVLVKQMRLVVKSKEEIAEVRSKKK